jgi:hypothetical protein
MGGCGKRESSIAMPIGDIPHWPISENDCHASALAGLAGSRFPFSAALEQSADLR